jgi:hypothetical protein
METPRIWFEIRQSVNFLKDGRVRIRRSDLAGLSNDSGKDYGTKLRGWHGKFLQTRTYRGTLIRSVGSQLPALLGCRKSPLHLSDSPSGEFPLRNVPKPSGRGGGLRAIVGRKLGGATVDPSDSCGKFRPPPRPSKFPGGCGLRSETVIHGPPGHSGNAAGGRPAAFRNPLGPQSPPSLKSP